MRKIRFIIACLLGLFGGSLWCHAAPIADTLHTTYVINTNFVPLHVVSVTAGGGLHTLMPKLTETGVATKGLYSNLGAGAQIQGTYTFFFHKYVGVTGGVGFSLSTGGMRGAFKDSIRFTNGQYSGESDGSNPQTSSGYMYFDYTDFHESEQLYTLDIPVGVTGRVSLTDRWMLRGTVGLGMSVVIYSHYKGDGQLTTTSDWDALNLHIDDDLPQHGFSRYFLGGYKGKFGNTNLLNMFVFGDFGAHYQYNKRIGFYAGVYFSYNVFNNLKPSTNELIFFHDTQDFITNPDDYQNYVYGGMMNSKFVEKITPLQVGLKFGVTFTWLDPVKCNCEDR